MTQHLGKTLRDKITGLTGIAETYTESLGGAPRYTIQPPGDGKTAPDGFAIDEINLEPVEGPSIEVVPPDETVVVKLGDKCKDVISGHDGVATKKNYFINGCVFFEVAGHRDNAIKNDDPGIMIVSHTRLRVLDAGWFERDGRPSASPVPAGRTVTPGGPRERTPRR